MDGPDRDRQSAGFRERTPVETARRRLEAVVPGAGRQPAVGTVQIHHEDADGRILAESVTAGRDVPHYERAAMDGYALRALDTHGASNRSPAVLRIADTEVDPDRTVNPGTATRVHTGSAVPPGADAVVMIEHVVELTEIGELEVEDAVAVGENVAPVGEDVAAGSTLYDAGHRIRPSDIGLLRSTGVQTITVAQQPSVAIFPTGEELVGPDEEPGPGQVVETNGQTVAALVERWGAKAAGHEPVTDDFDVLAGAIEDGLDHDVVVTTGGSSVGKRDLLPEVIDELGDVVVHGVALKPGHPVCLGVVDETPVLVLPGYPVACIVNAVQFLRPTIRWLEGAPVEDHPTVRARLDRKIPSEPGTRTFARVSLSTAQEADRVAVDRDPEASERRQKCDEPAHVATPTRASGSGVLSSVALADGWVVVEEEREGIPAGETVAVELWE